jgi:hypothetical protein
MSSFVYQNVINLIVYFPIWRCPSIFMNVAMWEHCTLTVWFWVVAKLTSLSLLISSKMSFLIVRVYGFYHSHAPVPRRRYPYQSQLYLLFGHARSEQWHETIDLSVLCMTSHHLKVDIIPSCTKKKVQLIRCSHSPFPSKMGILLLVRRHCSPPPPHHNSTSFTSKSDAYFDNSFDTNISDPAQHKLLTFNVPTLMLIFCCLCRLTKVSAQVRGSLELFLQAYFYGELLFVPRPAPKQKAPLVVCPRLLIQYIRSYLKFLEAVPPSAT